MNPGEFFSIRKYHGSAIIKRIKNTEKPGQFENLFWRDFKPQQPNKNCGIVNTLTIGPFDNNPKPIPTKKRPPQRDRYLVLIHSQKPNIVKATEKDSIRSVEITPP